MAPKTTKTKQNINTGNDLLKSTDRYHHGDLKTSLLSAAKVILQRDGADALSLRAMAAEVGVSHMAPYAHFKNKKELLHSIAEDGFNQMADAMEKDAEKLSGQNKPNAGELILTYGVAYLEFATSNPQLYRLMLGQVETSGRKIKATDPEPTIAFGPRTKRPFVLLRAAFSLRGDDEHKSRNQALGAWSLVHGMAALMIAGHIQIPSNTSLRHFLANATPLSDQF